MTQQVRGWPQTPPSDAALLSALAGRISALESRAPVKVVRLDTVGLTASVGSTGLYTVSGAGLYQVSCYARVTTAGAAGDTLTVTFGWNDGAAQTVAPINVGSLAVLNSYLQGQAIIYVATGQSITLATTVVKIGAPVYDLHADVQRLD